MDAFDADVLIYAAVDGHPLGRRVRALFPAVPVGRSAALAGIGSVLLIPELLARPARAEAVDELAKLEEFLGRLDLRPVDRATAELATVLGGLYGLRAADAIHLATAVVAGADRFLTDKPSGVPKTVTELRVVYPQELPVA